MATYLTLNLVVMAVAVIVLALLRVLRWDRIMTRILVVLLALTIVFDSLIIAASIVAYDSSKLLGVTLGMAPIEDLMYTILAVIFIPAIWKKLESRRV